GRGRDVEQQAPAEEELRVEVTEDERGVRHRGMRAALTIASRTGHRASARGSDPEQPGLVDGSDAAATGADEAHVDRWKAGHVAAVRRAQPCLPRPPGPRPPRPAPLPAPPPPALPPPRP